ncbi:recombinase family protein [Listeria monocytogenes]
MSTNVKRIGYIRVSTKDQNLDRQIAEMEAIGIDERDIYKDKQSGKDFDRIGYQYMKQSLRKGDNLYISSLDRLGRNYNQIIEEWKDITKNIGADITVLDMPLLDTTKYKDTLTDHFISDLVLQILSYVAATEREKIKKRQEEGIAVAKAKGKHLGRPIKNEITEEFKTAYKKWKTEEGITTADTYRSLNMSKTAFYRLVKDNKEELDKLLND